MQRLRDAFDNHPLPGDLVTRRNLWARPYAAFGVSALLGMAGCDNSASLPTAAAARRSTETSLVSLALADVIPGSTAGSFGTALADNSGRVTTEFWDNRSADDNATSACNIGFFAAGAIASDCQNQAAGSNANAIGGFTKYWGDGGGGRDASGFLFDGSRSYTVRLVGSYAGDKSEVGWFTKDAGGYQFTAVPTWSDRTIGTTLVIDAGVTGGKAWGFFIRNALNPSTGGCGGNDTDCSDAEGGYTLIPFNQFAMFSDADQSTFLVGAEDNLLELLADNVFFRDSDYNDYIWSVTPEPVAVGQGCSPGYWKTHSAWPAPYTPSTLFVTVFGENAFPDLTLQQVLATGGGGLNALGRQTVSALLNAQSTGVNFELSAAEVVGQFQAAFPGSSASYTVLKNSYEALTDVNGRVCPLN
jgi:hypothetical protein